MLCCCCGASRQIESKSAAPLPLRVRATVGALPVSFSSAFVYLGDLQVGQKVKRAALKAANARLPQRLGQLRETASAACPCAAGVEDFGVAKQVSPASGLQPRQRGAGICSASFADGGSRCCEGDGVHPAEHSTRRALRFSPPTLLPRQGCIQTSDGKRLRHVLFRSPVASPHFRRPRFSGAVRGMRRKRIRSPLRGTASLATRHLQAVFVAAFRWRHFFGKSFSPGKAD